jgi:hypothetical protein
MGGFNMDGDHDVSAHHWILALAIFTAVSLLGVAWEFANLRGGLGLLALSSQKLTNEVSSLRQELASQREAIDALKVSSSKSSAPAPANAPADITPRAKPHR